MTDVAFRLAGGVTRSVGVAGARLAVETVDLESAETILLVHGFPHTRAIWRDVAVHLLGRGFGVAAVDLRGLGDGDRPARGYDIQTSAADLVAVLDALGVRAVHAVGIDLGVLSTFALAATQPQRVASLTLIEATVGELPGAEAFFRRGAPWWFGFHQAPGGLAEQVVEGSEDAYIRYFLQSGSRRGVPEDVATAIVDSYRGRDSLRCAFEHYRAMPAAARWIDRWVTQNRLRMPVLTIGGDTVGDATGRQLATFADDLRCELIAQSGHIVCIDEPELTADLIAEHIHHAAQCLS